MIHRRYICPVGQGGFHIEKIGGMTVIYDCGAYRSETRIYRYLEDLLMYQETVDYLFISHFDKDHLNRLEDLLEFVNVNKAVMSYIPKDLRVAYNVATDGAYDDLRALLTSRNVEIIEAWDEDNRDEPGTKRYELQNVWEWIAKTMLTKEDFGLMKTELEKTLDVDKLNDAAYMNEKKTEINEAFKAVFGDKGPNSKGLIVLSQHCKSTGPWRSKVYANGPFLFRYSSQLIELAESDNSSCLYVGDADLNKKKNIEEVQTFLNNKSDDSLELLQIPHHGSKDNSRDTLDTDFPADYYFLNDANTNRLQKNNTLYKNLISANKLLFVGMNYHDMVCTVEWRK